MHPSRLFDSLCSDFPDIYIYIYILQNTSQKMYKAKEKKNMQWIQKKTRGLNQNYSSKSSQNKRKIEAL